MQNSKLRKIFDTNIPVYILSFLIPVLVLLIGMWIKDVYPMGDRSVLLWDLEIQYTDLFAWFRNVLHSGEGILYSFSKSLGGNMFGLYSLYLTSPLNLLIYFFEVEDIPAFFSVMTIIKIGLAGLTMSVFVTKRFRLQNRFVVLICAGAYALFEYNIAFCSNIHFLDSVYMLPMAALGVWQLVNSRKKALLYFTAAYVIICNWYIGYMVCLFTVFDFLFEYYLSSRGKKLKDFLQTGIRYAAVMILGVLTSAVFFLPAVLAAMNGKGTLSFDKLIPDFHVDPLYPLRALFITAPTNSEHGLPAVYVSYIIVLICIMMIINRHIAKRTKRAVLTFLFFVFISFSFVPFEIIWTDFKETYSFHHRYAFVFGFLMIMTACFFVKEAEKDRRVFSLKDLALSAGALVIYFGVQDLVKQLGTTKQILLTFFIIAVYAALMGIAYMLRGRRKVMLFIGCGVLLLFISEQAYNVQNAFGRYNISLAEYKDYAVDMKDTVSRIKDSESSVFYRTEKTFSEMSHRRNDREPAASEGFVYEYNGLTHYSSTYDTIVNDFLTELGYCKKDAMMVNYADSNFLADSLLGVKYLITETHPAGMEKVSDYAGGEGRAVYRNDYALSFGTVSRGNVSEFEWAQDPFESAETILNDILGEDDNEFYTHLPFEMTEDEEVSWNIHVTEAGPVYVYFKNNEHREADVYVNGEFKQTYFARSYRNVMYLGTFDAGETVNLKLADTYDKDYDYQLVAVRLDETLAKEKLRQAGENGFDPDMVTGGSVKGSYDSDEAVKMILQVPYDEGWKITINGKITSYSEVFNGLIEVELPAGHSEIEMSYCPPGLIPGTAGTAAGIFLFAVWTLAEQRYIRRKKG